VELDESSLPPHALRPSSRATAIVLVEWVKTRAMAAD
jgi:hypothetical protein